MATRAATGLGPWQGWALAFGWWSLTGFASASQYRLMTLPSGEALPWSRALATTLTSAYLWVPITVGAFALARALPLERERWRRRLPAYLAAALAVVGLRAGAVLLLNDLVGWYEVLPPARHVLYTSLAQNLPLWGLLVGVAHAVHFAQATRAREQQAAQLESQLAGARLAALKAQLQPHFLFNTLHAISTLMHRDVDAAERMMAQLSELLRRSLESGGAQEVTLREELRGLEPYLAIEQTRFGERLRVEWDVAPEVLGARVPHLLLQPLVENAVRHGLAGRLAPGRLALHAWREGGRLRLEVHDDGVGLGAQPLREGVGLANTRARLRQLYGDAAALALRPRSGGGTVAALALPFAAVAPQVRVRPVATGGVR